MDGNKGPRHGRIAGEKQRSAFFDDSGELITDRVDTQIWTVVTHSDNYKRRSTLVSTFNVMTKLSLDGVCNILKPKLQF